MVRTQWILIMVLAGIVCSTMLSEGQSNAVQSPATTTPKTAEQAFKNIQILKTAPADQLIPAMQFIAASLGVECDFCHVQGAFDKDDKAPKQKTRQMMQMMFAINQQNFEGHREVTCYSCHRGANKPVAIPVVAEAESKPEPPPSNASEALPPNLPTPAQVIDKYIQAIGGAEAIQNVTSRVEKGTTSIEGKQVAVEVFAKAPDKRIALLHLPRGDNMTAYDGQTGWLGVPGRPARELAGQELDGIKLDADLYFPVHIQQIFKDLRMFRPEKLGDHDAFVLTGMRGGAPPVKLLRQIFGPAGTHGALF